MDPGRVDRLGMARAILVTIALATALAAQQEHPIFQAAAKGDKAALQRIIELDKDRSAGLYGKSARGWTALHYATKSHKPAIVKLLLDRGAKLNARARDGKTPLHLAVNYSDLPITELLLKRGADPNLTDKQGRTAIMYAKRGVIVQKLIQSKAKTTTVDKRGMSMLHHYIMDNYWSHGRRIDLAVKHGVSIDLQDNEGHTPLYWCCIKRNLKKITAVARHKPNPRLARKDGRTPLHRILQAGTSGHDLKQVLAIMPILRQLGAPLDATDKRGMTPLHHAAKWGNHRAIEVLVAWGARTDLRTKKGQTAAEICKTSKLNRRRKQCLKALAGTAARPGR